MNIMTDVHTSPTLNTNLDLEPVEEAPSTEAITEIRRNEVDVQDWENNPATASWGPLMQEVCALWSIPTVSIEC